MKTFIAVDTPHGGEALIDINEISTIHWGMNVSRAQTNAEIMLKSGHAVRVTNMAQEPFLVMLTDKGHGIIPCKWVKANTDD